MVKQVKNLSPELDPHVLSYLCCLENREVGVGKSRANDDVAAEISKVKNVSGCYRQPKHRTRRTSPRIARIAHRCGEPLIDTARHCDRPNHVRPDRSEAGERGYVQCADAGARNRKRVAGQDIHRVAALQLSDSRKLPALNKAASAEGKLVDRVHDETVSRV